ncbi:hypothetical protein WJX79_005486 [Trebouxia sp. C0005]
MGDWRSTWIIQLDCELRLQRAAEQTAEANHQSIQETGNNFNSADSGQLPTPSSADRKFNRQVLSLPANGYHELNSHVHRLGSDRQGT